MLALAFFAFFASFADPMRCALCGQRASPGMDHCSQVAVSTQFRNDRVAYIHLQNAKRGCFSCQVLRA